MRGKRADVSVRLDLSEERLWIEDQPLELAPKPYAVLRYFVLNPHRLVTRAEIRAAVWAKRHVSESLVKGYVKRLRRVLGDDAKAPRFIETVRGRGYRFLGGITVTRRSVSATSQSDEHALNSIAILPFDCITPDEVTRTLAQRLASDVVMRLAKAKLYRVITSTPFALVDVSGIPPQWWSGPAPSFYLHGSVERRRGRLRTCFWVLAAATKEILWSHSLDLAPGDLDTDLAQISRVITGNLCGIYRSLLGPAQEEPPERPDAAWMSHKHVLRGYYFYHQRSKAGTDQATAHFLKAIELTPEKAWPQQACAFALIETLRYGWTDSPKVCLRRARDLAYRAFELDQKDYGAHWAIGFVALLQRDYDRAGAAFESALALSPDVPHLIADLGEVRLHCGDAEGAIAQIKEAQLLNVAAPFYYDDLMARAQADLGDLDAALSTYQSMGPASRRFVLDQAVLLLRQGRKAAAEQLLHDNPEAAKPASLRVYMESCRWGRPYQSPEKISAGPEQRLEALQGIGLAPR